MFETFSSVDDSKIVICPECGKQIKITITHKFQTFWRTTNRLTLHDNHRTIEEYDEQFAYKTEKLDG